MQIMVKHKKHGDMLLSAVLSALVFIMLAGSFFTLFSGQFTRIQAGRTAMQAEQYAEIDANTLRLLSYDDLDSKGAHARQGITSVADADGWQDEIVVGAEKTIDVTTESKQRIATIKIYKTGDTLSRYSLQVPLSSKSSSSIPKGIIIPWYGNLNNIPSGYVYCDGTNGTPDLRGRTIIGSGIYSDTYGSIIYNLGDMDGERFHKLTINEMPSHNHLQNDMNDLPTSIDDYNVYNTWHSDGDGPKYHIHSYTGYSGGDQAHNIMQPYYVLHYIMKQ